MKTVSRDINNEFQIFENCFRGISILHIVVYLRFAVYYINQMYTYSHISTGIV